MSIWCIMALTLLTPQRRGTAEILDLPAEAYTREELEKSHRDLALVNRYLGDRRALLKHLSSHLRGMTEFSLLDLATGSADLPVTIVEWARKNKVKASITAIDINEQTLELASKRTAGYPEITLQAGDALALDIPDRSFDIVLCCKTAHHMTYRETVQLIREMRRVARRGFILLDLRRSWIAYALIYLLTRLSGRNRVTCHDGPLSVLKAYTPQELAALAKQAGGGDITITKEPFWLQVLWEKLE
jgi:ubiquinone/menaquinone biosynthesis C-methylase UbiE